MYVRMACIIMHCRNYDVSFTNSKWVKFSSIFQKEDQFPCKTSGSLFMRFTSSDIGISCIEDRLSSVIEEVKAYALDQKKTYSRAKVQV